MHEYPALKPFDVHNARLAAEVRPNDWVNPRPAGRYHLVVIGGGTAGLVTAAGAAGLGAKVALIERDLLGGDCLNVGCVPSKSLLAAANAAATVRKASAFGVRAADVEIDFPAVMERMRRLRAAIAPHDSAARFRELGVDVYFGTARFTGPDSVSVGPAQLTFHRAAICTGSRPVIPRIPGIEQIDPLTNETVFSLTERPASLVVVGAGPIGCELAQAFARLGSHVWLIESEAGILPREDRECAQIVEAALRSDGVEVICGARVLRCARSQDGARVSVEADGRRLELEAQHVLTATGRQANVESLDLPAAGIALDEAGGLVLNERLQTTNWRVYAAGDVVGTYRFTHAADFMARIVVQNALSLGRRKARHLVVPWCTFTSPELAHVGLTAEEAGRRGIAVDTFSLPLDEVDRAVLEGNAAGLVRVHVRRGTDKLVGGTIVAPHAGEIIAELSLALSRGVGLRRIGGVIHPYPTYAEALRKLGDQYQRSRLTPRVRRLIRGWLALRFR